MNNEWAFFLQQIKTAMGNYGTMPSFNLMLAGKVCGSWLSINFLTLQRFSRYRCTF